eukprot:TRINITY_DN3233_c0_g1_i2.p2 TRINITY_DN3233_c0_g1~~TRINITY_DN3233_c0_g1_i2.p2  ORF type:complete len:196 (+),score=41.52 TRINITY_DN3233_c0_g1_i2:486-1073(+)
MKQQKSYASTTVQNTKQHHRQDHQQQDYRQNDQSKEEDKNCDMMDIDNDDIEIGICLWINEKQSKLFYDRIEKDFGLKSECISSDDEKCKEIFKEKKVSIVIYKSFENENEWKNALQNAVFIKSIDDQDKLYNEIGDEISRKFPRKINFYDSNEPFYEFTNFYQRSIFFNGKKWPTSETLFSSCLLYTSPSPRDA